jgi:TPR repeat protein
MLYSDGHGVAPDLVAAHMWFNLSAARLPPGEARNTVMKLRESVGAKLTAAQIAEAQNAARDWTPVAAH